MLLLLVDIDGTLLRVDRTVTRRVWSDAWAAVLGGQVPWNRLDSMAGKTDLQILAQLLGDRSAAQAIAPAFFDTLAQVAVESIQSDAISLCPHVGDFLHVMEQSGTTLVILTGNERRCGWHKLRIAGVEEYFVEGFFGCAALERSELVRQALHWARSRFPAPLPVPPIVVGDTPNDIACARAHQIWSAAVATGPFSFDTLQAHQPTACFRHLGEVALSLQRIVSQASMSRKLIIAIDGPAGSGKTTTARLLAERLGYTYIDTGAMYRALTLAALEQGIPLTDDALADLLDRISIELRHTPSGQRTFLNGRDVSERIREPDVTAHVSMVSSFPSVRRVMVRVQQQLGRHGGVVMDGRDIGTAVFPDADIKVFMTADLDTRARRRQAELHQSNPTITAEEIKRQLDQRDRFDSTREHNPLRKASDALVIDTTNLTVEEQVECILDYVRQRTAVLNSSSLEQ